MKKLILISSVVGALSLTAQAQDDMYFVPSKKEVAKERAHHNTPHDVYYSGSDRDVDEYNRRYQYVPGDSTMGDVINFSSEEGVYPDSVSDYNYTRQMSRWDGYTPTDAYWQGYDQGRSDEWAASSWHSPWFYSSYRSYYYPWYDTWYDPWYYDWSWRHGWYYDPWYYNRPYYSYGWGYYPGVNPPHHGGGYAPVRHYTGGKTYAGTHNHSLGNRGGSSSWVGTTRRSGSGVRQATSTRSSNSSWSMGNSRTSVPTRSIGSSSGSSSIGSSSGASSMGNSRSSGMGSTRSSSSGGSYSGGGSFGGSRGSGSSLGGGRTGGRR